MKAVILCAGYATRLYPMTIDTPKALLAIKDKPMLNYILEKINETDVNEVYIISNDKFYLKFVWWLNQNKSKFSKKIEIINDETSSNETRLGAIGDLNLAIQEKNINEDLLVILGDNLFSFDLGEIISSFRKTGKTTIGIRDLKSIDEAKRHGVVAVENSRVTGFIEKPENPPSTLCSLGIYVYSKNDLGKIAEYLEAGNSKDAIGNLVGWFHTRQEIYAHLLSGYCYDIGTVEMYNYLNQKQINL